MVQNDGLKTTFNEKYTLDKKSIILGNPNNSALVNYITMVTKHEIYKNKWTNKGIYTQSIVLKLKKNLEIEEYVSTITIRRKTTLGKWSQIYNQLKRWAIQVLYTNIYVSNVNTKMVTQSIYYYKCYPNSLYIVFHVEQ